MQKKLKARILSLALSALMVISMMQTTVFATEGGDIAPGASSVGEIQSFNKLEDRFSPSTGKDAPSHVYGLAVEQDTPEKDLNLPDELTAMVARTTTVTTSSDATEDKETIPVTWNSDKEYKSDEKGQFIYTAEISEDYILADGVKLPQIYVSVGRQARAASSTEYATPASTRATVNPTPHNTDSTWLQNQFNSAADGGTVQLNKDLNIGTRTIKFSKLISGSSGKAFTLDLNGHTITYTAPLTDDIMDADPSEVDVQNDQAAFSFDDVAQLTITDTSAEGKGEIIATSGGVIVNSVANDPDQVKLTIKKGTITAQHQNISGVPASAAISFNNGTIIMEGGTVSAAKSAAIEVGSGDLNISGGTVSRTSNGSAIEKNSSLGGVIRISGTAKITAACKSVTDGTIKLPSGATKMALEITGGTVETTEKAYAYPKAYAVYIPVPYRDIDKVYSHTGGTVTGRIGLANDVSGTIKGSDTNSGIAATLQLKDSTGVEVGTPVQAAADGQYTFKDVHGNTGKSDDTGYTIEVSMAGYTSGTIPSFRVEGQMPYKGKDLTLQKATSSSAIDFFSLTADGSDTQATTELTLKFNLDVEGLTADHITLTGATKGTLTKESGTGVYKLAISDITVADGETVTVAVAKDKLTFTPAQKTVKVRKTAGPVTPPDCAATIDSVEYDTLQEAITAVKAGETIVLQKNLTEKVTSDKGHDYSIDLNGKKLTSAETFTMTHSGTGKLTIKDSGTGGTVENTAIADYTGAVARAIQNEGTGTIEVNSGTVRVTGGIGVGIYNETTGSVKVTGGKVEATSLNNSKAINNISSGSVTVTGGEISSLEGQAINNSGTGPITVSGNAVLKSTQIEGSRGVGTTINSPKGQVTLSGAVKISSYFVSSDNKKIRGTAIYSNLSIKIKDLTGAVILQGREMVLDADSTPSVEMATGVACKASTAYAGTDPVDYNAADIATYQYMEFKAAGPSVTVGKQNGTITEGKAGSATFAVSTSGFTTSPTVGDITTVWCDASGKNETTTAPTGIALAKTSATLITATATSAAKEGTYYFKVTATKGGRKATSDVVTLTVKAKESRTLYFDGKDNKLYFFDSSKPDSKGDAVDGTITGYTVTGNQAPYVLTLNNFKFETSAKTALYIPSGGTAVISSKAGTTNVLKSTAPTNATSPTSAITNDGILVTTGTGTLQAIGDNGIYGSGSVLLGDKSNVQASGTANGSGIFVGGEVVMAGAKYTPIPDAHTNTVIAGIYSALGDSTVKIKDNGCLLAQYGPSAGLYSMYNLIISSDVEIDSVGIAMYSMTDTTLFGKCGINLKYGNLFGILSGSKIYGAMFYGSKLNIAPQAGKEAQALAAIFCASRSTIVSETDNMFGGKVGDDEFTYSTPDDESAQSAVNHEGESVQDQKGKAMKSLGYEDLKLPSPTFTPKPGTYEDAQTVSMTADCTIDGNYAEALANNADLADFMALLAAQKAYLPAGSLGTGDAPAFMDATSNAITHEKIYYTTDDSTPSTTNGTEYTGAITVDEKTTFKAITTGKLFGGMLGASSDVATAKYVIGVEEATIAANVADKTYDGKPATVTPTAVTESGATIDLEYTYKWQKDTDATGINPTWVDLDPNVAPKAAGKYKVTITGTKETAETSYEGEAVVTFEIAQKVLTVKPNSFTMTEGGTLPTFVLEYDGLIEGDDVTASAATLECKTGDGDAAVDVDGKTPGTYSILWREWETATFSGDDKDNYEITANQTGTLKVNKKGSSGGGGGSNTPPVIKPTKPDTPTTKPGSPQTGDSSNLMVLFTLLLASGGTLTALLARRRKTGRHYSK